MGPVVSHIRTEAELAGQPIEHAVGAVESITYLPTTKWDPDPLPIFHIRVEGQLADYRCMLNLQPQQQLLVDYRRGKSGTIYIESVRP